MTRWPNPSSLPITRGFAAPPDTGRVSPLSCDIGLRHGNYIARGVSAGWGWTPVCVWATLRPLGVARSRASSGLLTHILLTPHSLRGEMYGTDPDPHAAWSLPAEPSHDQQMHEK